MIKESKWDRDALATAKIEVAGKTWDVVLGPPIRLDSRGLDEVDVVPGKDAHLRGGPAQAEPERASGAKIHGRQERHRSAVTWESRVRKDPAYISTT